MKQAGNTILVTGGGSGIGRELARRWHDGGNTVIVAGRRREALDETIAGRERMHAVMLDVDSEEGVTSFVERLLGEHPALNVLVNNAGIMRLEDIAAKRDLHDAEETITTNLLGPIRLTNALVEHLAAQPDAAIVNVTSLNAVAPSPDAGAYPATKAAVALLTQQFALALGPHGIRVNAVAPGFIDAGMSAPIYEDADVRAV